MLAEKSRDGLLVNEVVSRCRMLRIGVQNERKLLCKRQNAHEPAQRTKRPKCISREWKQKEREKNKEFLLLKETVLLEKRAASRARRAEGRSRER